MLASHREVVAVPTLVGLADRENAGAAPQPKRCPLRLPREVGGAKAAPLLYNVA